MMSTPFLSIIVPVLNEADTIVGFLRHARSVASDAELIVIDGVPDGTLERAAMFADITVSAPQGRAAQMNAGRACARRCALVPFHVDPQLPRTAQGDIRRAPKTRMWPAAALGPIPQGES